MFTIAASNVLRNRKTRLNYLNDFRLYKGESKDITFVPGNLTVHYTGTIK